MENFRPNPGGFPPQQFLSNSTMANGPQQMNGVTSQQDPSQHHSGYYQQPKQPFPSKVSVVAWNSRQNRFSPNMKCCLSYIIKRTFIHIKSLLSKLWQRNIFFFGTKFVVWIMLFSVEVKSVCFIPMPKVLFWLWSDVKLEACLFLILCIHLKCAD